MANEQYREMFVQEAHEHIDNLNEFLLKLEKDPDVAEHVNTLFREAHSLKGMAATMGYDQISALCMAIESLFDKLRNGQEKLSANLSNILFKCFDILLELVDDDNKKVDLEQYLKQLENPSEIQNDQTEISHHQIKSQATVRVKMKDLDSLVNLVGELIISKMRLEQTIPDITDETHQVLAFLGGLVSDLQYQTMKVRLVPMEQIFNRFPRMVRDLATNLGKEIKLEMDGLGIELDRTVLDIITDPILHILRNSIDHGMENPDERESLGKPRFGTIKLTAYKMGDRVAIEISDNGRGINLEKIKQKAVEKKIITVQESQKMTESEIIDLLGTPGLSSASSITDVSGRGVGLDVVFKQVEGVGGHVSIKTKNGSGTSMIITIPFSLSMIGGLLIKVENEKYVIPLSSITTTVSVPKSEIKTINGKEVIILREQILPLIKVAEVLGVNHEDDSELNLNDELTVVIVDKGGKSYGLIVDSYESMQEIVTKRMNSSDKLLSSFSDATILADGRVVLILDPAMVVA